MIDITSKEILIDPKLKNRLEFIFKFAHKKATFINGSIKKINKTNLLYLEPHKIIVDNYVLLAFNYCDKIYINNLKTKINISYLGEFLKN